MTTLEILGRINIAQDLVEVIEADTPKSERMRLPSPLAIDLYREQRRDAMDRQHFAHCRRIEEHCEDLEASWKSIATSLARIAEHFDPCTKPQVAAPSAAKCVDAPEKGDDRPA